MYKRSIIRPTLQILREREDERKCAIVIRTAKSHRSRTSRMSSFSRFAWNDGHSFPSRSAITESRNPVGVRTHSQRPPTIVWFDSQDGHSLSTSISSINKMAPLSSISPSTSFGPRNSSLSGDGNQLSNSSTSNMIRSTSEVLVFPPCPPLSPFGSRNPAETRRQLASVISA